jgi:hypothetical protein
MNESDFETELRKLRPATPSRRLAQGIADELDGCDLRAETPRVASAAGSPRVPWLSLWLDRLLWTGLGAAAVLVLMIAQGPPAAPRTQTVQPPPQTVTLAPVPRDSFSLQPVLASEEDLGWREEGVRFDAQGRPLLKLRRVAVERKAWADLEHAGVVQMETPRQEVMWVPVPMH